MSARPPFQLVHLIWLLTLSAATLTAQNSAPPADPAAIQAPALPEPSTTPPAAALPRLAPPAPGELLAAPAAPAAPPLIPPTSTAPAVAPPTTPADTVTPSTPNAPSVALPRARVTSSTSTSGQFIIHGETLPLRSAFSSKCEEIAESLRKLLKDNQAWGIPIIVLLSSGETAAKAPKAATTSISQLAHGGFHIQVTLHLRPDLRQAEVRRELLRALLAERILRGKKEIVSQRTLLPDWLFTGIIEALDYRSRARPSTLFAAIFKSGKIYSIEEIIEATPGNLDALSKTLYQTSCCALVLSLLDQPEGGTHMAAFLSALASDPRPERQLLDQHFPGIASSTSSLNKWWAIQLAALASPSMAEPMDLEESLTQLESALTFRFQAPATDAPPATTPTPPTPQLATTSDAPPSPTPSSQTDTSESEEETAPRRSIFSRLNPFSRQQQPPSDENPEAIIAAAIEKTALDQITLPTPAPLPEADEEEENGRPTLLTRILRRTRAQAEQQSSAVEEVAAVAQPTAPKATPPAAKATKPEASPESPAPADDPPPASDTEAPARRSMFNPLNWFRNSSPDTDAEPSTADPAAPQTSTEKPTTSATFQSWLPTIAALHLPPPLALLHSAPNLLAQNFLGIRFGKKKNDSSAPEEAPASGNESPPAAPTPKATPPATQKSPEPASPAPTAAPPEQPVPEETSESPAADEERPSRLNPLNWFRKKNAASQTQEEDEEEAPKTTAEVSPMDAAPTPAPPLPQSSPTAPPAKNTKSLPQNAPMVSVTLPLEDYATLLKRKDAKKILDANILAIAALQNRAHVILRPIIAEYSLLLTDLYQGKTKNAPARIAELRRRTRQAIERAHELRAMLDVHEANSPTHLSGLFEDYLRLPETLKTERPERTDPISRYLDSVEREFSTNQP